MFFLLPAPVLSACTDHEIEENSVTVVGLPQVLMSVSATDRNAADTVTLSMTCVPNSAGEAPIFLDFTTTVTDTGKTSS